MATTQPSKPLPYTANPLLLMANDLMLFLQITFTWPISAGLPSTVIPLFPMRSGSLDELAFSPGNYWDIFLHVILIIAQTTFIISLFPLAVLGLPPVFYFAYVIGFILGNQWFTVLLNGPRHKGLFQSHPDCVKGNWPKYDHEKWVFINGVSVGDHWLQSNLDLLAMTFRRPVYGIHNQTRGIIFDVLECIIQRDLSFATEDIRTAYAALLDILSDSNIHKVVLILHSQGGIEGGLVLDWLYDTVPADQLGKLEIYTFGNAANHWNAPIVSSINPKSRPESGVTNNDGVRAGRIVQHIEHYANEGDYVSKFGILHFRPDQARPQTTPATIYPPPPSPPPAKPQPHSATRIFNPTHTPPNTPHPASSPSACAPPPPPLKTGLSRSQTWTRSPKTPIERADTADMSHQQRNNRFFGRLFKRAASGHMLNQHYLDYMFEMAGVDPQDLSKGRVKEGNDFMDKEVDMRVYEEWDTVQAVGQGQPRANGNGNGNGGGGEGRVDGAVNGTVGKQVKELSRLWAYRNGGVPASQ